MQITGDNAKTALPAPPVSAAIDENSLEPLFAWAREQGGAASAKGGDLAPVVESLLDAARDLPEVLARDGARAKLVAAAAEAYGVGRASTSNGRDETKTTLKPPAPGLIRPMSERVAELTALHRVISAANSSLKLDDMLNEIAQAVVEVTHADICSIFLYEPEWDQLVLTATNGLNRDALGKTRLRMGEGITGWAALVGKPVPVREAWNDARFKYVPALQEERTVSMLAVPIVLFTKEKLVGVIDIHTFIEVDFSDPEIKFLETVAGEIAIAIENARLYEQTDSELRQKVTELSTLQGVSAHIASTLNLTEVLSLIAQQASHLVKADAAAIYELSETAPVMELVSRYDLQHPGQITDTLKEGPRPAVTVEQSVIAQATKKGTPTALPADADASLDLPFSNDGYRALFCVPLLAPRGIMGGICLYNREDRTFSDDQIRLLDAFGREAAIALENSRLYDAALKGLQTKSALLKEMNHRVRNNLQTVAGLLSMQLRRLSSGSEAAAALRESVSRIQSIAVVHDLMMSGSDDVESISVYDLARKVTDAVVSTLVHTGFRLKLDIEPDVAGEIRVNSSEATLLALLFNELVSNAILHGFAGLEQGEITIRVKKGIAGGSAKGRARRAACPVTVVVEDSGQGVPQGFDVQKNAHLGLSIVRTLVTNDLGGSLAFEPRQDGPGVRVTFTFVPSA